jgi:hypothetical protein
MSADEFFALTDEEAEPFLDAGLEKIGPNHQYHGELGVYHGLHCLNTIRIHLDKDYYLAHGGMHQDGIGYPPNFTRAHLCKMNPTSLLEAITNF